MSPRGALLFAVFLTAAAAEGVVAVGRAPATGDAGADRAAALADARRRAVEEVVGVMVNATVLVHNELLVRDVVLTKAAGLVRNEKVTAEGLSGDFYEVTLSCDVEPSLVATELDRLRRAVVINVAQSGPGLEASRAAEGIIREELVAAGYECLDAGFLERAGLADKLPGASGGDYNDWGRKCLARVFLTGEVGAYDAGVVENDLPYVEHNPLAGLRVARAEGNVRAIDTFSARIMAERQARPGEFVGFGETAEEAAADALARLAEAYAAYFAAALAAEGE